jgi:curved DNA-binding protein CbpA
VTSPLGVLGLPASAEVTDDDVRAAWRRVADATHPDRADGGDPAAFADAAAAYALLRTQAGRNEALGDVPDGHGAPSGDTGSAGPVPSLTRALPPRSANAASQISHGRPLRFALRVLTAVAAGYLAVAAVGWQPASAAIITGALTWLLRTGRAGLA